MQIERVIVLGLVVIGAMLVAMIVVQGVNTALVQQHISAAVVVTSTCPQEYVLDGTSNPVCDDNDPATWNILSGTTNETAGCVYRPKPRGTFCNSSCFGYDTGTVTDGKGTCTNEDPTTCVGYCIPSYGGFIDATETPDLNTIYTQWPFATVFARTCRDGAPWNRDVINENLFISSCTANQKTLFLLLPRFATYAVNLANTQANTQFDCMDMMNKTSDVAPASCMIASHITVDSMFMDNYTNIFQQGDTGGRNPDNFHYIGRICFYRYACGQFNTSAMADPDIVTNGCTRKRTISASEGALNVESRVLHSQDPTLPEHVLNQAVELFERGIVPHARERIARNKRGLSV